MLNGLIEVALLNCTIGDGMFGDRLDEGLSDSAEIDGAVKGAGAGAVTVAAVGVPLVDGVTSVSTRSGFCSDCAVAVTPSAAAHKKNARRKVL